MIQKIVIWNPAPDDETRPLWGDHYFGESLVRSLADWGGEVSMTYWPHWPQPVEADLLLVLRGKRVVDALPDTVGMKAMWLISHPAEVKPEEFALYDVIFVASKNHARALRDSGLNAHTMLQCTDPRIFHVGLRCDSDFREAFVFVGNTRAATRPLVERAVQNQLPLRIWGSGWFDQQYRQSLVTRVMPNDELGGLYRSAFCTFNDHWPDMRAMGYVNNRIFDALACAVPVLSEPHEGVQELGFRGVRTIDDKEDFQQAIDRFLIDYPRLQEAAYEDAFRIEQEHTFDCRAKQLIEFAEALA